jgi:TolB protein
LSIDDAVTIRLDFTAIDTNSDGEPSSAVVPYLTDPTPEADVIQGIDDQLDSQDLIAFISQREGSDEIYLMNADGSALSRLTDSPACESAQHWSADGALLSYLSSHPASDEAPTWSPDGTRIAFASDRDGKYQIYVMNADGTNVTRLTEDPAGAGGPVWQLQTK